MLACIVFPLSLSAACMCSVYMSVVCMSLSLTEWGLYFLWGWNAHTPECARAHIRTHGACDQPNRTLTRSSSSHTNTYIYAPPPHAHTHRACHVTPCLIIPPTQPTSLHKHISFPFWDSKHSSNLASTQSTLTCAHTHLSVSSWCVCACVQRRIWLGCVCVKANADERGRK